MAQPRVALKLIAAATAALALLGLALVLLVATLMGGLAPQTCGSAGGDHAPCPVALADIPGNYLQWIRQAGARYALDWSIVAGIYFIETDFGRLNAPGVQVGENFAGAGGPGQFLSTTWERYGVDGDGDGVRDRYDPVDAIPSTANLLRQNGAPTDYTRAIFAYNHASWYVADVLARAARYHGAAEASGEDAVQLVGVADLTPTAACGGASASGPADLATAVRLTSPAAYRALPAWAMAGGRPREPVDARIYEDVLWVLHRYGLRVSAARETGHHTHGDGTALGLVPAISTTQSDWDATAGRTGRSVLSIQGRAPVHADDDVLEHLGAPPRLCLVAPSVATHGVSGRHLVRVRREASLSRRRSLERGAGLAGGSPVSSGAPWGTRRPDDAITQTG